MGFLNNGLLARKIAPSKRRLTTDAAARAIEVMERRVLMSTTFAWNFGTGTANPLPSSGSDPNISVPSPGYGIANSYGTVATPINTTSASNYTGASGSDNLGNAFQNSAANQTLNTSTSPYYTVTLAPSSGNKLELDGFTFAMRSTGTGPTQVDLRSSIDNFSSSLESVAIANNSTWTLFTPTFAAVTGTANASVELRLYLSGGNGAGNAGSGTENDRIDDVSIAATAVPATTVTPSVTSLSPALGTTAGGNTVLINGTGFTNVSAVKFGSTAAGSYNVLSPTQISAAAPAGTGTVDVTVTNTAGTSATSASDKYTYTTVPVVAGVSPSSDATLGGAPITITGSGFSSASGVKFGTVAATSFTVNSDTKITAVDPAESVGTVDVTVTGSTGTSATSSSDQFTYVAPTTIASVEASATSGTVVTLNDQPIVTQIVSQPGAYHGVTYTNYGFLVSDGTGSVEIYGFPAGSSYTPSVGDKIAITGTYAPFHGIPEITTPTAIRVISQNNSVPAVPVTTISQTNTNPLPNNIAGYLVTIKGVEVTGLSNTDGQFEAANLTGTITDTTGASQTLFYYPSSFSTETTNLDGTGNLYDQPFPTGLVDITGLASVLTTGTTVTPEFIPLMISDSTVAPVVTGVNANAGPIAGGNTVTVSGYGFSGSADGNVAPVTQVLFNGVAGTNLNVANDNTLTITVPQSSTNAAQTVDVQVVNGNGTSATNTVDKYTYTVAPVVTSVSPVAGPANSTTAVTIFGTNFSAVTGVKFGTVPATGVTVVSSTQINVTAPAEAAGQVDVTVTTAAGGTSSTSANDLFTYAAQPTIGSIAPNSGAITGGTTIVITGTNFVLGGTTLKIGGQNPTSFAVNAPTQITAVVPAGAAIGPVDVVITTAGGTATSAGGFTYTANNVATAEAATSGSLVTINSDPVITAILSAPGTVNTVTYSNYAFLIQDSSGSVEVFGKLPTGSTYTPTVGDTISLAGTYSPFNQIPEIASLTAITKTGTTTNIPAPLTKTVPQVNSTTLNISPNGVGEYLINLNNVFISGLTAGSAWGSANLTGTITDSTGNTVTLYYYVSSYSLPNSNLGTQNIPASTQALNITGFADVFSSGTVVQAEFIPISVTPVTATAPAWLSTGSTYSNYVPNQSITITSGTIIANPATTSDGSIAITDAGSVNTNLPAGTTSIQIGSLSVTTGSVFSLRPTSTTLSTATPILITSGLTFTGTGKLDIANGYLDIAGGSLGNINTTVGQGFASGAWTGNGIYSSVAAADPTHLTGVGVAPNSADGVNKLFGSGAALGLFDGANPGLTDVLVKYTYYGDANLSGKVDGTDYNRIDSGFTTAGTGWFNGNFNYDTTINGSDYTLIDNAFNRQTSVIAAQVASTAPTHTTVVPTVQSTISTDSFSKKKVSMSIFDQLEQEITTN